MDPQVVPFDLHRMFIGNDPPLFYLEIVLRCVVIYLWSLGLLRWIGGRGVSQLSMVEFLLVIALGSAVGDALFYPEVPLGHAMLVILVIVVINKVLDSAILRWDIVQKVIDGRPAQLMRRGQILGNVRRRALGVAELNAELRAAGIRNLGEVEAVYMEANGRLSIFRQHPPRPGLRIEPPHELVDITPWPEVGPLCCANCGLVAEADKRQPDGCCPGCGHQVWTRPILVDSTP